MLVTEKIIALPVLMQKVENAHSKVDSPAKGPAQQMTAGAHCFYPRPTQNAKGQREAPEKDATKKPEMFEFKNSKLFLSSSVLRWKTMLKLKEKKREMTDFWGKVNPRHWQKQV